MKFSVLLVLVALLVWIGVFGWLGRAINKIDPWAFMLVGSGLITFFGVLLVPGAFGEDNTLHEGRIRFAICATLIVVYVVYLGSSVYFNPFLDEQGRPLPDFATQLFPSLTNLLTVTVSFYFGSSAAVEIAKKRTSPGERANAGTN